jgi:FKBP-type peptidyl-prolyl cis-trans isomerase 2
MLEGISQAVVGMQEGEAKTLRLTPEEAFGPRDPALQQRVPRAALPGNVQVGDRLIAQGSGRQDPVWVRELEEDFAVVDGNHPLAGLNLTFDLELVSVEPAGQTD